MRRHRTSPLFAIALLLLLPLRALPQEPASPPSGGAPVAAAKGTGAVMGTVTDAEQGQPLEGATVAVSGTSIRVLTDSKGVFGIASIPAGSRFLEVSKEGYLMQKVPVDVRAGERTKADVLLPSASVSQTIEIRGRLLAPTERRQILERRNAAAVSDRIGAEEIQQTTASNAGDAASRLPAVTIVDGRFAFVRGLGDRYSQTLFNDQTLPSPEPDRRVVPLDLFPANLIESLVITKTYSPDLPGEFAGGSVQIHTTDVPPDDFFKVGLSLKYVDGTTFQDFDTYQGGNLDAFAADDGTRELPSAVPSEQVAQVPPGSPGLHAADVQRIGRSFPNRWDTFKVTAPPDKKVTLSFGKRLEVGDAGGAVGVVGAFSWGNKYQTVRNETFQLVKNGGSVGSIVFNSFDLNTSTFTADLSGLLNITYELNPAQRIGIRNFITRSADDRVRQQSGYDGQAGTDIRVTQLRWVQRMLYNTQLYGEHLLVGDTFLKWHFGYSLTRRDEPDNRQVRYEQLPGSNVFQVSNDSDTGRHWFFSLDEHVYDVAADYAIPFNPFDVPDPDPDPDKLLPDQRIQIGGSIVDRSRDFDSRRFRFIRSSLGPVALDDNGNPIDLSAPPEVLYQPQNINPNGFILTEVTQPTDNYKADQTLRAGYMLADFRILRNLRLQGGARLEQSEQKVDTFALFGVPPARVEADLKTTDLLPAVNLTWQLPADMQIRLAASQTVSRPEFRELSAFEFTDIAGGYTARGNPDLKRAKIQSADLRWEWYPTPGELVSFGGFAKRFEDPIEEVLLPTGSQPLTTWQNARKAKLYGFEVEMRKNLGVIADFLKDFSTNINFALIKSEVRIPESTTTAQTNDKRPLQGQPKYTFNASLFYKNAPLGFSTGVLFNTFGRRISAVGSFGVPDEEEQPRFDLDLIVAQRIGRGTVRLSFENILNDKYQFKQGDIVTHEYKKGWSIALSYSITF